MREGGTGSNQNVLHVGTKLSKSTYHESNIQKVERKELVV